MPTRIYAHIGAVMLIRVSTQFRDYARAYVHT
jgi:hypothetical protein